VTLKPFDFAQAVARAGLNTNGMPLAKGPKAVEGGGFQAALTQALGSVSNAQNQATALQREVQLDNPTVSIEETMVCDAEGTDRVSGDLAGSESACSGLLGHHEHAGLRLAAWASGRS